MRLLKAHLGIKLKSETPDLEAPDILSDSELSIKKRLPQAVPLLSVPSVRPVGRPPSRNVLRG